MDDNFGCTEDGGEIMMADERNEIKSGYQIPKTCKYPIGWRWDVSSLLSKRQLGIEEHRIAQDSGGTNRGAGTASADAGTVGAEDDRG